jgi:protein-S-isoprenylcysteine O-methyltransferase Ste14
VAGGGLYGWCLLLFLLAGGTPAIFFTRHFGFLIGREPGQLVRRGPYRYSRNPMYVAVLATIPGQSCLYRSSVVLGYRLSMCLLFHTVVVLIEEPHLRLARGEGYEEYLRSVPRWVGRTRQTGFA